MTPEEHTQAWSVIKTMYPTEFTAFDSLEQFFRNRIGDNDKAQIEKFVKEGGYPIGGRTAYGRGLCPLSFAANHNYLEMVDFLFTLGASIHDLDECDEDVVGSLLSNQDCPCFTKDEITDEQVTMVLFHLFRTDQHYSSARHQELRDIALRLKFPLAAEAIMAFDHEGRALRAKGA